MKKPALIIGILIFVVIILSFVRIFISNKIATSGVVLAKLEQQIDYYQFQNTILAEQLYQASSLTNIDMQATALGFEQKTSDFVLNSQLPVAFKQ